MTYLAAALHSWCLIRQSAVLRLTVRRRSGGGAWDRKRAGEEARMTQPAKSQEPSMEEILASIRRIIADDDASKSSSSGSGAAGRAPKPSRRRRRHRQSRLRRRAHAAACRSSAAGRSRRAEPLPAAVQRTVAEQGRRHSRSDRVRWQAPTPRLRRPPLAAARRAQFRTIEAQFRRRIRRSWPKPLRLCRRRFLPPRCRASAACFPTQTSAAVDSAFNTLAQTVLVQNARTLEDLVREMLRPMLKSWLDDNLPGMVERLVRAEIERVARGGR